MPKLRLSSYKSKIERGRWLNILPIDRLCTLCNKLEDEFHVICECPCYDTCRKLYIKPYYIRKRIFMIYKDVIFNYDIIVIFY